jgi:AmmeMemoRadiSam system protein B
MNPASRIRPAAVAGMFYPGDAPSLSADIATMLSEATPPELTPKALIVPHAGYVYSGPVAASAYSLLQPLRGRVRRVVLLGPAHRVTVRGLAVPQAESFVTPLGSVAIDSAALRLALCLPQVELSDLAHAQEHSLEVQLPFLQSVLGDFKLAPFVVGQATAAEVAAVIDALWNGDDTLIVISSDLSHYHPYGDAQRLDRASVESILDLVPLADHEQACGATAINGMLEVARQRELVAHLLDLRNSGDTAGDKSRVVGYAALAFSEANPGHVC